MRAQLRRAHLLVRSFRRSTPTSATPFDPIASSSSSSAFSKALPFFVPSLRRFCAPSDAQPPAGSVDSSNALSDAPKIDPFFEDVSNEELKRLIDEYSKGDDENGLELILDALLKRRFTKKHEETDDEMLDELRLKPRDDIRDQEFESDREEALETDEEIDNLYSPMDYVKDKMSKDPFFNMDDRKWDEMVKEGIEKGVVKDTKECEEILEDMLSFDKLLPAL